MNFVDPLGWAGLQPEQGAGGGTGSPEPQETGDPLGVDLTVPVTEGVNWTLERNRSVARTVSLGLSPFTWPGAFRELGDALGWGILHDEYAPTAGMIAAVGNGVGASAYVLTTLGGGSEDAALDNSRTATFAAGIAMLTLGGFEGLRTLGRGGVGRAQLLLPESDGVNPWLGTIRSTTAANDLTMYRVWGGESAQVGYWLTPVRPASADAARSMLSLPGGNSATFVSEVTIPAGTRYQIGVSAPAFGQPGGAVQVQLLDRIPASSFGIGVGF